VLCTGVGFGFFGWIAGVICGHMAKTRIRINPNLRGNGLATAGLILNYTFLFLLAFGIGLAFYFKGQKEREQKEWAAQQAQQKEQQARQQQEYKQAVAENRVAYREPKLEIPTNAVSGQVGGQAFQYEHAIASMGSFLLRQGDNLRADRQVTITTFVSPADLASKTLLVTADMRNPRLQVTAEWLDAANQWRRKWVPNGYYLKATFGQIENKQMKGSIEIRMPGAPATAIKGDFIAAVK